MFVGLFVCIHLSCFFLKGGVVVDIDMMVNGKVKNCCRSCNKERANKEGVKLSGRLRSASQLAEFDPKQDNQSIANTLHFTYHFHQYQRHDPCSNCVLVKKKYPNFIQNRH